GNWIAIELQGSDWNPWGYGARIFVDTDGRDYWREVNDGLGLRAQSETGHLVLGYGNADLVNIRIEWPDGEVDCVTGAPGQTIAVPKGLRPCMP
ncbi:MAG: ASPIC/UnbV domain-containing protein, partial [Actinomycetota bacterium]|nr:ASPIC/UnbV domain-containing protein [Actinomycetota bacterium]